MDVRSTAVPAGWRRVICAGALVIVAVGAPASSTATASGPATLATEQEPTGISAYGARVVWSSFDPETKRFSLMSHAGGRIERLPVRTRKVAFDADLGIGPDGAVTAVYSRCADDPLIFESQDFLPNYAAGSGCRLFRFSFKDRKERRLRFSGRSERSEFMPTIWRSRIGFGRVSRPGGRPRLLLRSLKTGAERSVRLPRPAYRGASGVLLTGTDLLGTRLVSAWDYQEVDCRRRSDPEAKVAPKATQVFAGTPGRQRAIAAGCELDDPDRVYGAEQSSKSIFALASPRHSSVTMRRTYSRAGELVSESPVLDGAFPTAFAVARRSVYYVVTGSSEEAGQSSLTYDIVRSSR